MSLTLVSFDTGNFQFSAYAVTETIARELLRRAWATHCQQTDADPVYLDEFYDDVNVITFDPPCVIRDWSEVPLNGPGLNNAPSVDRIIEFAADTRIGFDINAEHDEFSMDEVCALLHYHLGVEAYVEYTGGGCATIYAGERGLDERNPAIGGPGWFEKGIGDGLGKATASWHEFAIGKDDDGETQVGNPADYAVTSTRQLAALIALYVIDSADLESVEAIGLDATQRGIPQNGA